MQDLRQLKTVTLRNLPPEVIRLIRKKAAEQGASINKTVIRLLEGRLGVRRKKRDQPLHHDLDALAGTWSKKDAARFDEALAEQRSIDPELWK